MKSKGKENDGLLANASTIPSIKWQPLKTGNKQLLFTNAQIINYFVLRTALDGLPASDMKSINDSALNLFRCGHVQDINLQCDNMRIRVKAKCLPEMRKDRVYILFLSLDTGTQDIVEAECGCPAGKGPSASCKHIGALCFALEEFSRVEQLPEFVTCTERLQEWNKCRPKKLDIIPVSDLTTRRCEILKKDVKGHSPGTYDPRRPQYRKMKEETIDWFRCDLFSLKYSCAFLDILVPSLSAIHHDHTYALSPETHEVTSDDEPDHSSNDTVADIPCFDPVSEELYIILYYYTSFLYCGRCMY